MTDNTNNRYDLTSLFNKRMPIEQARPPITELALAAERAENMRRHKVYSTAQSKNWNPFSRIKKHPERSTGDAERAEEARRSNEETT